MCPLTETNGKHMHKLFENTTKNINKFTNFVSSMFSDGDKNLIKFCRIEYGNDWQWAYLSYKKQGQFPNIIRKVA